MKTFIKTFAFAAFVIGLASAAQAQSGEQISVSITYDRAAPSEQIYANIDRSVKKACKKAYRFSSMTARRKAVNACRKELTANAVSAINQPALSAYYKTKTGKKQRRRLFASRS